MTESEAVDRLMELKGEALAGTGWEGYLAAGRGFMVTDLCHVGFFPACMVVHFPPHTRKRVERLLRSYDPTREVVVFLAVPCGGKTMMALGKRTPALSPEQAFLKLAGTPGMPPMQVVEVPLPEGGEKGPVAA